MRDRKRYGILGNRENKRVLWVKGLSHERQTKRQGNLGIWEHEKRAISFGLQVEKQDVLYVSMEQIRSECSIIPFNGSFRLTDTNMRQTGSKRLSDRRISPGGAMPLMHRLVSGATPLPLCYSIPSEVLHIYNIHFSCFSLCSICLLIVCFEPTTYYPKLSFCNFSITFYICLSYFPFFSLSFALKCLGCS